jgi:hypothetical protein
MRRRLPGWMIPAIVLLLVPGLLGAAGCGTESCGGQCGPPWQFQVIFRPGTSTVTAAAIMRKCRGQPVVRVGQVHRNSDLGEPTGSLTATLFTRTRQGRRLRQVLNCTKRSPSVTSIDFLD